jgi:uncharacterized protein YecE (DUF72 family)
MSFEMNPTPRKRNSTKSPARQPVGGGGVDGSATGRLRIGISGWTYPPWRGGTFYPEGWAQKRELEYASRQVNSIEINGTFYSLQRPKSFHAWHEATPGDFMFSVKGPRFITHLKRLKDAEAPLANFFGSGVLRLAEKLGPMLWQLPPSFVYKRETLEAFFKLLPHDTRAAAALARRHDEHLAGRAWTETDAERPVRHAMEVRHASFENPEFIALLRDYGVALVVADTAGKWPVMEDATADFVYVRLHGDEELYVSGYTDAALANWERKIRAWADGGSPPKAKLAGPPMVERSGPRDVFVYFDNDVKVRSPYDAMTLAHRLGIGPKPVAAPDAAKIAEVARMGWPGLARSQAAKWGGRAGDHARSGKKTVTVAGGPVKATR